MQFFLQRALLLDEHRCLSLSEYQSVRDVISLFALIRQFQRVNNSVDEEIRDQLLLTPFLPKLFLNAIGTQWGWVAFCYKNNFLSLNEFY